MYLVGAYAKNPGFQTVDLQEAKALLEELV